MRIVIIGNSGGGKSTLALGLGNQLGIEVHEVDKLLWRPGWELVPEAEYEAAHSRVLGFSEWIFEGLGRKESIEARIARATHVVLIDFPLWQHFLLAAERELAWVRGGSEGLPGGMTEPPPTKALFETIWNLNRDWLPDIRACVDQAKHQGKPVFRVGSPEELASFTIERG